MRGLGSNLLERLHGSDGNPPAITTMLLDLVKGGGGVSLLEAQSGGPAPRTTDTERDVPSNRGAWMGNGLPLARVAFSVAWHRFSRKNQNSRPSSQTNRMPASNNRQTKPFRNESLICIHTCQGVRLLNYEPIKHCRQTEAGGAALASLPGRHQ